MQTFIRMDLLVEVDWQLSPREVDALVDKVKRFIHDQESVIGISKQNIVVDKMKEHD